MIKKLSIIICTLLICLSPVFATRIPTQDQSIYVNDYADVIDSSIKKELVSINQSSDHKNGGYVVVATFDFVDDDLYDFSYRLFNRWGIGDKNNNNGVLLVLDIGNDNYSYILGSGIEKILSDGNAKSIIDKYMEPDFAKKNYGEALLKTSKQFLNVIEDSGFKVSDSRSSGFMSNFQMSDIIEIIAVIGFIIVLVFISALMPKRSCRPRNYGPRRYHRPPPPPPGGPRMYGGGYGRPRPRSRPSSRGFSGSATRSRGFSSSSGGTHHSGGSSRGAGGTRK